MRTDRLRRPEHVRQAVCGFNKGQGIFRGRRLVSGFVHHAALLIHSYTGEDEAGGVILVPARAAMRADDVEVRCRVCDRLSVQIREVRLTL